MTAESPVEVPCVCGGNNPMCVICVGEGMVTKPACHRCHGTGREGASEKPCFDCRGMRYRDLNTATTDDIVTL